MEEPVGAVSLCFTCFVPCVDYADLLIAALIADHGVECGHLTMTITLILGYDTRFVEAVINAGGVDSDPKWCRLDSLNQTSDTRIFSHIASDLAFWNENARVVS